MDREIELIKKEYEDKMKKKKSKDKKGKSKDDGEDKKNGKDDESKGDVDDEKAEKEKDAKVNCVYSAVFIANPDSRSKQSRTKSRRRSRTTFLESTLFRSMIT